MTWAARQMSRSEAHPLAATLDEIEIEHQVKCRDHDHIKAEADADEAASVDVRYATTEQVACSSTAGFK